MKKRIAGFVCGCVALALIAGSFAFYTSTNSMDNQLKTIKGYGETATEKFTPDTDWEPGEEVDKVFGVKNTGDGDILVRIKLNEQWWRDANRDGTMQDSEKIISFDSTTSGAINDIVTYSQANATDGDVTGDKSVVEKTLAANGWTRGTDGYWYYNTILTPTGSTSQTNDFMTKIKLLDAADMGKKTQQKYWTENETIKDQEPTTSNIGTDSKTSWVVLGANEPIPSPQDPTHTVYTKAVSGIDSAHPGYAGAIYDLFITYDAIQANVDAVKASDGWNLAAAPAGTNWGFTW